MKTKKPVPQIFLMTALYCISGITSAQSTDSVSISMAELKRANIIFVEHAQLKHENVSLTELVEIKDIIISDTEQSMFNIQQKYIAASQMFDAQLAISNQYRSDMENCRAQAVKQRKKALWTGGAIGTGLGLIIGILISK